MSATTVVPVLNSHGLLRVNINMHYCYSFDISFSSSYEIKIVILKIENDDM